MRVVDMSAQDLVDKINDCVANEWEWETGKSGASYASPYEAYAVLLEELEDAMADVDDVRTAMNSMWHTVKAADDTTAIVRLIERSATLAAAAMVKVAAAAAKARNGYDCENHD